MFQLTEIEEACGVTMDDIQATDKALYVLRGGMLLFPVNTSASLCSATARYRTGKPHTYKGMSSLRHPVYGIDRDAELAAQTTTLGE